MKTLLIALAAATPALADVETFIFEFEFLDALDGAKITTEDFEAFEIDSVIAPGSTVNGVTYNTFPTAFGGLVGDDYFNLDLQGLYVERDGVPGQDPATEFYYPGDSVTVTFAQPVTAVAMFFNVGATLDATDYVFIETPVGTATSGGDFINQDPSGLFFCGLVSDEPFTTATFGSTFEAPTGWNMDNMHRVEILGDFKTYDFDLSGCQEVPRVSTTGTGNASVTVDTLNNTVTVEGSFSDLTSPATAAHIHGPAKQGQNAGVILTLELSGDTSGFITGNGTLTPAEIDDVLNGLTYVNVHSDTYPGGEIRGQIVNDCAGDFNGDGTKSILDFVAFQTSWVNQECEADINNDLVHNILDFVAFQGIFQEACDDL